MEFHSAVVKASDLCKHHSNPFPPSLLEKLIHFFSFHFRMSTTSTTTTSVTQDHTLGNDPNFTNHICVLTIARGYGTLFDANSLLEKDIIELCVGMGWVHPNGVLWLTATELVIAFHFSKEMLATVHLITSAMVWCDGPIRLHTRPPTTAQI